MPDKRRRRFLAVVVILTLFALAACNNGTEQNFPDNSIEYHENIEDLFTQYFQIRIALDPQLITKRRFPEDVVPSQEDKLTPVSFEYKEWQLELAKNTLEVLEQYSDSDLTEVQRVNKAIMQWSLETAVAGEEFFFHDTLSLNKLQELLAFMLNYHTIDTLEDAENYLSRLEQFPAIIKQLRANLEVQREKGFGPPVSTLDLTLQGIIEFDKMPLRQDFAAKVEHLPEKDELTQRCDRVLKETVKPVYSELGRQIQAMRPQAVENISELPGGKAYYTWLLGSQTTTNMTPEEVHQACLAEVSRLQEEIKQVLNSIGHESTDYIKTLNELYYDKPIEQSQVLDSYRGLIAFAEDMLPELFGRLPKTKVEVWPITENTAGYLLPTRDDSRPGVFFTNPARNHSEMQAKWFTWHEAIPGHHMQFAIEHETDIPFFRDFEFFTGYIEGWGTYGEMLLFEFGLDDDPIGYLGALNHYLMLAARGVVDTGINYKGWSRQEAAQYFNDVLGNEYPEWVSDLSIRPGRAVSYFAGVIKIRQLREKTESELGDAFDIRDFHDLVLGHGSMPLVILEELVDEYIEQAKQ